MKDLSRSSTDPIFAAIEAHKAAYSAWLADLDDAAADSEEGAALGRLSSTSPTTAEGITALAAYASEHLKQRELPDAALAVLANIAAARAA